MNAFVAAGAAVVAAAVLQIHPLASSVAEAGDWKYCMHEGGYCEFKGTNLGKRNRSVRYGENPHTPKRYTEKTVSGGIWCRPGPDAFGADPVIGTTKHCWYYEENWEYCMHEGGYCKVRGTQSVRYAEDPHKGPRREKKVTGGVWCRPGPDAFGEDPAYGKTKKCWVYR